jgi:hypothetical protein
MIPKQQTSAKSKVQKPSRYDGWTVLSWDDLAEWAGSRSVGRGRTYQKQGPVHDLAIRTASNLKEASTRPKIRRHQGEEDSRILASRYLSCGVIGA